MAYHALPTDDSRAGRRRHSRLRVSLPSRLITLDGTLSVTLLDLSLRGAKVLLTGHELRKGANAVLTWAGYEAFCTVVWTRGGFCGLDFDAPLKPRVLLATRDLADTTPKVDGNRIAARDWAAGVVRR